MHFFCLYLKLYSLLIFIIIDSATHVPFTFPSHRIALYHIFYFTSRHFNYLLLSSFPEQQHVQRTQTISGHSKKKTQCYIHDLKLLYNLFNNLFLSFHVTKILSSLFISLLPKPRFSFSTPNHTGRVRLKPYCVDLQVLFLVT
jgi:hypothetical protein